MAWPRFVCPDKLTDPPNSASLDLMIPSDEDILDRFARINHLRVTRLPNLDR